MLESRKLPVADKQKKAEHHVPEERVVLVTGVSFQLTTLLGGDAAFLMEFAGVSLQSKTNQLFNLEPREDSKMVWAVDVLPRGESPRQFALRVKPSSFEPDGTSWFLDLILLGMSASSNLLCVEHTKKPDTEEEVTVAGETPGKQRPHPKGRAGAGRAVEARDSRGAGQNTQKPKLIWTRADLREIKYDPETFLPGKDAFDGDDGDAADRALEKDVAMRVPIVHDDITRHLGDAAGKKRLTPLEMVLMVCSLHCAMRTCKKCINLLTQVGAVPAPSPRYICVCVCICV